MTWQSGRQLASINKDGLSATFAYDANGHRTQKTVNGVTTNYYWVGDRLQYMATGDDMYVFFYDDKGTPYGVFTLIDGVQEHLFYLYNAQGDVIAIIDDYAERVVNYEYSAWGELLSVTGSKADTVGTLNPFRYRGYCYDTETGLYYLNSRYYDPVTQRFLNGDGYASTGQGILGNNMFAYCGNNPMNNYDPYGEFALSATACGLIFALASTLTAIVLVDSIAKNPPVLPPISLPRSKGNDVTQPLPPLPKYLERSDDSANAAPKVKAKEKATDIPLTPDPKKQAFFTLDPYEFKPNGLIMKEISGSYNGKIIQWFDPMSKAVIFEWDEDLKHGSHYHTLLPKWKNKHDGVHYAPGTPVPEPFNSIYFGG